MDFGNKVGEQKIGIMLAPMIDIVFLLLIFFVSTSVFYQLEAELSVTVPTSTSAKTSKRFPGEIVINVAEDGKIIVNQVRLTLDELSGKLRKISELYSGQPVIIRADRRTRHESVIRVLDACAKADIWNISFATLPEQKKNP